jgi:hypothetical protein
MDPSASFVRSFSPCKVLSPTSNPLTPNVDGRKTEAIPDKKRCLTEQILGRLETLTECRVIKEDKDGGVFSACCLDQITRPRKMQILK